MSLKQGVVISYFLGFGILAGAQDKPFTILYSDPPSGVIYRYQGDSKRVLSGVDYPAYGIISLKRNAWVNLVYKNHKKKLEGPAIYDLAQLAKDLEAEKQSTFMGRFWGFLSNSVHQTSSSEKLEKYHREYMTNARAGISGFGEQEYGIKAPVFLTGLIAAPKILFQWDSVATNRGYSFQITDRETKEAVFTAQTRSNQLTIDLSELNLAPDGVYQWDVKVFQADTLHLASPPFQFAYTPDELSDFLTEVKAEEDYLDLEPFEQELYVLSKLEEEGFYHSAYTRYGALLNRYPDQLLYKKLYAAFLVRMNALPEAKQQLKNISEE